MLLFVCLLLIRVGWFDSMLVGVFFTDLRGLFGMMLWVMLM